MFQFKYPVEQSEPPRLPKEMLPTMYDLPSEDPEEPGLPDEFHDLQPQLLSRTCRPPNCSPGQMFTGTDINLYYDIRHSRWYKRPDWFLAIGVPRLYQDIDMRLSYVIWQEEVTPQVVVELLSPGTEAEDLGENVQQEDIIPSSPDDIVTETELVKQKPPKKWEVYEQILQIPYYIVFSRYTNRVRAFTLVESRYQEITLDPNKPQVWIPQIELGLGLWQGEYELVNRLWLRWYDATGNWVLTDTEQALQRSDEATRVADEATRVADEATRVADEATRRANQAEALLEQQRRENERLLERLRQLEGQ
jgi:Uma2 family endonuclease